MKRNPKQEGTNLHDARTQVGLCKLDCNQCFYNRPGAFYCDIEKPQLPSPDTVGHDIVRMNCGNDSNTRRCECIKQAEKYENFFFNTSIPQFEFPGPVVYTANRLEEEPIDFSFLSDRKNLHKLMFVRLRVSASNKDYVKRGVEVITKMQIPVVLTFMAYYEKEALDIVADKYPGARAFYIKRIRHINEYWCPLGFFMRNTLHKMKRTGGNLVSMCGAPSSNFCRDCMNCAAYYWIAKKRIEK